MPTRAASRVPSAGGDSGHRRERGEPGADRPLGIVLVGRRPAEIGQDAVAQELRDVALVPRQLRRDRALVGGHDLARVLGIEAGGERGRAHEVDEDERELAPLAAGGGRDGGSGGAPDPGVPRWRR